MKLQRLFFFLAAVSALVSFASFSAFADTYVRGHYRKNGTYVAPHYRSSPNSSKLDNWSTKGNINPHTGAVGTKRVDAPRESTAPPAEMQKRITRSSYLSDPTAEFEVFSPAKRKELFDKAQARCANNLSVECIVYEMRNERALEELSEIAKLSGPHGKADFLKARESCSPRADVECVRSHVRTFAELRAFEQRLYGR